MYLLTANLCIYSEPIYRIFRSPWQLMPSFSTESLNQWGPLASCRYFINVVIRDEWGRVFVTGGRGRRGSKSAGGAHILLISANWNHMLHHRKPWFALPYKLNILNIHSHDRYHVVQCFFSTMTFLALWHFLGLWPEHQRSCLFHPRLHPRHVHPLSFALWKVRTYRERDVIYKEKDAITNYLFRDSIAAKVMTQFTAACSPWGICVERVEVKISLKENIFPATFSAGQT